MDKDKDLVIKGTRLVRSKDIPIDRIIFDDYDFMNDEANTEHNSLNSKDLPGWSGQYKAMFKELRKQRKGGLCQST